MEQHNMGLVWLRKGARQARWRTAVAANEGHVATNRRR
jgi:hypothetical protein